MTKQHTVLWALPVTFETTKLGTYWTVTNTDEAARALLTHWPVDEGESYERAKAACLAALEGNADPEEARAAFLAAADEAGVFVRA